LKIKLLAKGLHRTKRKLSTDCRQSPAITS